MTVIHGSIELLLDAGRVSEGVVVITQDVDALPEGLAIMRGLSNVVAVDPPREGVDREWTAKDHDGLPVEALFRVNHAAMDGTS